MLVELLSALTVGALAASCCGARLLAMFASAVMKHTMRNEATRAQIRDLVRDVASRNEKLAEVMFTGPMRQAFVEVLVDVVGRSDFADNMTKMLSVCLLDTSLKKSITEGVGVALQDMRLREQLKQLIIDTMLDQDLQRALLTASISTVKQGIKDGLNDADLRDVITSSFHEALEDPRLNEIIHQALREVVADSDLHRATFRGAVGALNPVSDVAQRMAVQGQDFNDFRARLESMNPFRDPSFSSNEALHEMKARVEAMNPFRKGPNDEADGGASPSPKWAPDWLQTPKTKGGFRMNSPLPGVQGARTNAQER